MSNTPGKRPQGTTKLSSGLHVPFDYAAQWAGKSETEELELPGGNRVLVRQPDLPRMAKRGLIPNHILPVVEKFVLGGMPALIKEVPSLTEPGAEPGATLVKTADLNDYIDAMCVASCVEPRLSFDGGEPGTISVALLSADEKFAIWDWGVGLTARLAEFRQLGSGAVEPVGPLPDGEGVRDDAEPDAGADVA